MAAASHATRLRERLKGGPPLVGTFVKLPALESIDLVRSLSFDLACIDGEHSQLDEHAILALLRHGAALDLPMLVRTSSRDAGSLNRMLEAGASGIQLSTLRACAERDIGTRCRRGDLGHAAGEARIVEHPGAAEVDR